jgi:hypothetical protein
MLAKEWLKRKGPRLEDLQPLVIPAIVILVGLAAFALGRLSALGPVMPSDSATIGQ